MENYEVRFIERCFYMFHDINLDDLFDLQKKEAHTLIDVRSSSEFEEATIPGSINIPLFSDEERAKVGTLYKQVGKEEAKQKGLEIFSAKLPNFIKQFQKIDTPMTVFCWRGGMRSRTAATVLDLMGIHANRLHGGIRSYRQWIVHELDQFNDRSFPPNLYVLNGYTGSGKTIILHKLAERGYPMIDLEDLAGHRGSIFGQIGLKPNKQKKFDSLLVHEMKQFQNEPFIFIEGESKRIGKAMLPEFLYNKKENGKQIFIHLPFELRVKIILDEYDPEDYSGNFIEAFQHIKKHIHTPIAKKIEKSLQIGDYITSVKLLLEYYYDPRYEHHSKKFSSDQITNIHAETIDEAVHKIELLIK